MAFDDKIIHQVWAVEQEILDVIDDVCKRNNLRYSLFYGTLIGAIRHKGFIPWDDDIDIAMPREDYEKLLSIWESQAPAGYLLQTSRNSRDNPNNFAKIRKDNTTYLQTWSEAKRGYHKGIFVDVFPADRTAPGKLSGKLQYVACAVNLLYSRGYKSGSGGIIDKIETVLLKTDRKNYAPRRDAAERYLRKWNGKVHTPYICACTIGSCKDYFSADIFEKMGTIEFQGKEYPCVSNPGATLTAVYGDYMQFPPEEERVWHHHPLVIDFYRNFEDIPVQERDNL